MEQSPCFTSTPSLFGIVSVSVSLHLSLTLSFFLVLSLSHPLSRSLRLSLSAFSPSLTLPLFHFFIRLPIVLAESFILYCPVPLLKVMAITSSPAREPRG